VKPHALFPDQTTLEASRHAFLMDLKAAVVKDIKPRIREQFEAAANVSIDELPAYRWYSALARAQHELYVDSTAECVERQAVELRDRCREIRRNAHLGTLQLDPSVAVPEYQSGADIHCVPGGYAVELMDDDVYAAARYELGITLYTLGQHGQLNDSKGQAGVAFLRSRFPAFRPRDILELGCSCGNSTLPYVDAFPEARVHAVDVSAPLLRYAHARSELLGRAVHYRQASAEALPWADNSVDLVCSHILMHETSRRALSRILLECHRVLRPGGIMLHIDVPVRNEGLDALDRHMADWETLNNNEPFWRGLHAMDLPAAASAAGFAAQWVFDEFFDSGHVAFINRRPWWMFGAVKGAA
jgi:ubiquinone/menaquinone biosynthesis C-methylase UbiE